MFLLHNWLRDSHFLLVIFTAAHVKAVHCADDWHSIHYAYFSCLDQILQLLNHEGNMLRCIPAHQITGLE